MSRPYLRQVRLIHQELLAELAGAGFSVQPGDLGENIATAGVDLLGLPVGAALRLGSEALIVIAGLRNPCHQIDEFASGLRATVGDRTEDGELIRKAGVMVVVQSGAVAPGDPISSRCLQGRSAAPSGSEVVSEGAELDRSERVEGAITPGPSSSPR